MVKVARQTAGMHATASRSRILLRRMASLAVVLVGIYLLVSVYFAHVLAHPVRLPLTTTPAQYGLAYEDVQFTSAEDNIPLKGWFIDSQGTRTIVVMHGSSSNRDNYINMEMAKALAEHGYDLLLFDFRAHGESGGDIYSLGSLETRDVAGALAYLKGRGVMEVGALAYSMGAATELLAAPDHPEMRAIVADSSFARLFTILDRERARRSLPALFTPGILLASKVVYGLEPLNNEPRQAVARLGNRPVLLIHSTVDDLIPVGEAYELQQAGAGNPNLELWVAQGSGHVTAFADNKEEYVRRVLAFFDRHLGR